MVQTLSFNKSGYDPFIDFLKAYAIVFVVVSHSFPVSLWNYCQFRIWADMQVPMFVLIQVFHAYKKGTAPSIKWSSMLKRIVLPFVGIQTFILAFRLLFTSESTHNVLISSVYGGGYGPGSYYFWIYIQVAIILVILWPLVKKISRIKLTLIFLLISVGFEILFSLVDFPDRIYRLLAVRYLFLVPLALIWLEDRVELNVINVILSLLSIAAVIYFSFFHFDLEPFFYNTGWSFHRWICYFYLPYLLTFALWFLFSKIRKYDWIETAIKEIAKSSYEIYLIQMLVFVFFPMYRLSFIQPAIIRVPIWMMLTFALSIIGGILMNRIMQKLLLKKK